MTGKPTVFLVLRISQLQVVKAFITNQAKKSANSALTWRLIAKLVLTLIARCVKISSTLLTLTKAALAAFPNAKLVPKLRTRPPVISV